MMTDRYELAAGAILQGIGGIEDFPHQADYLAYLALDAADRGSEQEGEKPSFAP